MSDASAIGKALVDEAQAEFESLLDALQVHSGEAREHARKLAELSIALTASKLLGQDTAVAEKALVASAQNIAAAASVTVAKRVVSFADGLIIRLAAATLKIVSLAL